MPDDIELIKRLYIGFNARDIDAVLVMLTEDVMWANAMEGGYARGHDGLRDYWTRQWSLVIPHVAPVSFTRQADGSIFVEVVQTIRDLAGRRLQDRTQGLKDKTVGHVFHLEEGQVRRFDVQNLPAT